MPARTPVAMARVGKDDVLLVCDDGAAFFHDGVKWNETDPVPGTVADLLAKRQEFTP